MLPTGSHAAKAEKANLAVIQGKNLLEQLPPPEWRKNGHQTLEHKHQCKSQPKAMAVHGRAYRLRGAGGVVAVPEPRMALKNSDEGSSTMTSDFLLKLER